MQKNWAVIHLNKKYFLKLGKKGFGCQIGSCGLKMAMKKVEGDKTTPIGKWCLETLYYRPDKSPRPKLKKKHSLKINTITQYCGWCDDITSNYYNKYIKINNSRFINVNYENLWRGDSAYDIIIVISYNLKPTIKNKGSAIFIHCSFSDFRETAGCIALKKRDLTLLLKNLSNKVRLDIKYKF